MTYSPSTLAITEPDWIILRYDLARIISPISLTAFVLAASAVSPALSARVREASYRSRRSCLGMPSTLGTFSLAKSASMTAKFSVRAKTESWPDVAVKLDNVPFDSRIKRAEISSIIPRDQPPSPLLPHKTYSTLFSNSTLPSFLPSISASVTSAFSIALTKVSSYKIRTASVLSAILTLSG